MVHLQDLFDRLSGDDRALLQTNGLFIGRAIAIHQEALGWGDFLIRSVMDLDQESSAMTISDCVREGETIQFHVRDATTAREDLEMSLLSQAFFEPPRGALLSSCNARGTRLYGHSDGDVSTIQGVLGDVPMTGFFCAGELGPISGENFLHGHTASLALF